MTRDELERFEIQAWTRERGKGAYLGPIATCASAEAVGVALVTLTADGECDGGERRLAVWDREREEYVGGPPW